MNYQLEWIDKLNENTAKLSAMLTMISGGGYESFDELNDTLKSNYLWACSDLARDTNQLALKIGCEFSVVNSNTSD